MSDTIVIYHGGCRDGFCAAWVYNKYVSTFESIPNSIRDKIEYHPGYYGQELPDCKDKDVIIVDFCYPLESMKIILAECNSLVWLDHHKTAEPVAEWFNSIKDDRIKCVDFDMSKSGAGLACDYFFPNEPRPWLVDYVEDRDLWVKKLPNSDEINAFIACLEFDFKVWDKWSEIFVQNIVMRGEIAIMKTEQYVREVCKNVYFADVVAYEGMTEGIMSTKLTGEWKNIPIVNIAHVDSSEVCNELLKLYLDAPFSLYWFKNQRNYQYGLRSRQSEDVDVSAIAKLFGGGGHKNAAGFQLKYLLAELR